MTSFFVFNTGILGTGEPLRIRSTIFRVLGGRMVSFWEVIFGMKASSLKLTGGTCDLIDEFVSEWVPSLG